MAFTRFPDPTNNISNLANQPVEPPATLKQKFDQFGEDSKDWTNNIFLPELESTTNGDSGADNIGATALSGGVATTVQGIVEELDAKIDTQLPTPDGSITDAKLSNTAGQIKDVVKTHIPNFINVLSLGIDNTESLIVDNSAILQNFIDNTPNSYINLYFPEGTYLFETTVTNDGKNINIKGEKDLTNIKAETSTLAIFKFSTGKVNINDVIFTTNSNLRTEFTVYVDNAFSLFMSGCFFTNNGSTESGLSIENTIISSVDKCLFNHASISLKTADVKITNTWVWALWRPYAIGIHGGCVNITLENVDIVPPFRTEGGVKNGTIIPNRKAGIWINSENGTDPNCINMTDIYFDGNPTLDTGIGMLVENSFGVVLNNFRSNQMNSDVIVIDSCYDVVISKGVFVSNNKYDQQAKEIVVRNTYGNKCEDIDLCYNHFINYSTTTVTVPAPAIKVETTANGAAQIEFNNIGQASSNNAYGNKEIDVVTIPSRGLSTNRGTTRAYKTKTLASFTSGQTAQTVPFTSGLSLAYLPTYDQVSIRANNSSIPPHRVQIADISNAYIQFDAALTKNVSFYLFVDL